MLVSNCLQIHIHTCQVISTQHASITCNKSVKRPNMSDVYTCCPTFIEFYFISPQIVYISLVFADSDLCQTVKCTQQYLHDSKDLVSYTIFRFLGNKYDYCSIRTPTNLATSCTCNICPWFKVI